MSRDVGIFIARSGTEDNALRHLRTTIASTPSPSMTTRTSSLKPKSHSTIAPSRRSMKTNRRLLHHHGRQRSTTTPGVNMMNMPWSTCRSTVSPEDARRPPRSISAGGVKCSTVPRYHQPTPSGIRLRAATAASVNYLAKGTTPPDARRVATPRHELTESFNVGEKISEHAWPRRSPGGDSRSTSSRGRKPPSPRRPFFERSHRGNPSRARTSRAPHTRTPPLRRPTKARTRTSRTTPSRPPSARDEILRSRSRPSTRERDHRTRRRAL